MFMKSERVVARVSSGLSRSTLVSSKKRSMARASESAGGVEDFLELVDNQEEVAVRHLTHVE